MGRPQEVRMITDKETNLTTTTSPEVTAQDGGGKLASFVSCDKVCCSKQTQQLSCATCLTDKLEQCSRARNERLKRFVERDRKRRSRNFFSGKKIIYFCLFGFSLFLSFVDVCRASAQQQPAEGRCQCYKTCFSVTTIIHMFLFAANGRQT